MAVIPVIIQNHPLAEVDIDPELRKKFFSFFDFLVMHK